MWSDGNGFYNVEISGHWTDLGNPPDNSTWTSMTAIAQWTELSIDMTNAGGLGAQWLGNLFSDAPDEVIDVIDATKVLKWIGNAAGVVGMVDNWREFQQTGDIQDLGQCVIGGVSMLVKFNPYTGVAFAIAMEAWEYYEDNYQR